MQDSTDTVSQFTGAYYVGHLLTDLGQQRKSTDPCGCVSIDLAVACLCEHMPTAPRDDGMSHNKPVFAQSLSSSDSASIGFGLFYAMVCATPNA